MGTFHINEKLNVRRNKKRDDPFDRSLNSVIYSVVANRLDVKKRGGGRLQRKATRRPLSR